MRDGDNIICDECGVIIEYNEYSEIIIYNGKYQQWCDRCLKENNRQN